MATHEKELTRAAQDIDVYKAMASGQWAKEDELRSLKAQAAELDRKIALTLAPVEEVGAKEEQNEEQTPSIRDASQSQEQSKTKELASPADAQKEEKSVTQEKDFMSRGIFCKPKMR